jgi:parallel beta-helix repeat protein
MIVANQIVGNFSATMGGGISLFAAGAPTIDRNLIAENTANEGGALAFGNTSDAMVTNNLMIRNIAGFGGAMWWLAPSGSSGLQIVNNTLVNNVGIRGSAIFADGFGETVFLTNNILSGSSATSIVECGDFSGGSAPVTRFNDVINTGGGARYGGLCSDQTGINGNVSVDPSFADPQSDDFHLRVDSPLVDTGTSEGAPTHDFDGDGRPADGNGDGVAAMDIGADEIPTPPLVVVTDTRLDQNHSGPIVIGADNISLDCRGHTVSGAGGMGISLEGRQGITIRNCTVTGFDVGFGLVAASDNSLIGNMSDANGQGYLFESSHDNRLTRNSARNSGCDAFILHGSGGNTFTRSVASDNGCSGFGLFDSSGNTFTNNQASRNVFDGIFLSESSSNLIQRNVLEENGGNGIWLTSNSNENRVLSNSASNSGGNGIQLSGAHFNRIEGNVVTESGGDGVSLEGSTQNVLLENIATSNSSEGFDAFGGSAANSFFRNVARRNGSEGFLVREESTENRFEANVATLNSTGFVLLSNGSELVGNASNENAAGGYFVAGATGNVFTSNSASRNGSAGFSTSPDASDNRFVRNSACRNGLSDGAEDAIDAGMNNIWIRNSFCTTSGI